MIRYLAVPAFALLVSSAVSTFAQEINFRDPQTWILGYFQADDLLQNPHGTWFNKEFDSYHIDEQALIELINMDLEDIEVLVVMGIWCPDSRREVPRFLKLSQVCGLRQDKISFLGTDSNKEAPVDDYEALDIERVPTFIFYYNKNEIGRIIEYPEASLEKDMVNILETKDLRHKEDKK